MGKKALNIRNFSIVAHIDHGKSTLADRLLEHTGAVTGKDMAAQVLDSMDLERERGITIKAHSVRLEYKAKDGKTYILNLLDTPGHVDFSYEVSRSLASCEGALLVVDASQGLQAQSLANAYLAIENNLAIIPVVNKIDLPAAEPERVLQQIADTLPIDTDVAPMVSAKKGIGTQDVLEAIVARIPPPEGDPDGPLTALIFDSWFDQYRGSIMLVRVFDGKIRPGMRIKLMSTGKTFEVDEIGVTTPKRVIVGELGVGEVGYVIANIRTVSDTKVGDTVTDAAHPATTPLPGYKEVKPMVYSGLYPIDNLEYEDLRDALEKLRLNDGSFDYEPESSVALGFGFRCGYLGLLHMEIVRERLEREFNLSLISTTPTVSFRVTPPGGVTTIVHNPSQWTPPYEMVEEPFVKATIFVPERYVGQVMDLCQARMGEQKAFEYLGAERIMLVYEMPLSEILWDFFDKLKSISRGYASLDYELIGFRKANMLKLDVLINGDPVDALSLIVHDDQAYHRGRRVVDSLQELIPRQMFEVAIQAAVGGKVLARSTVRAMRKDVTAKCYGGDITRKRKLLEKQKEGKKRMRQVGKVEIPQEAFLAVLKVKE